MVTLIIMDGLGESDKTYGNAVYSAGMPNLQKLRDRYPFTTLECSGEDVGLEKGQMSGSEVGHLNLGAGRIVFQDLSRINNAIKDKTFFQNKQILDCFAHIKKTGGKLHLLGLLSDGGVHSSILHLKALVDMAKQNGIKDIAIHAFTDGRDTPRNSAVKYVRDLQEYINDNAKIASLCGRFYAMDREKRYDRVQMAYDMLVLGHAENYYCDPIEALEQSYAKNIFDEFVLPTIIGPPQKIECGDSVIFFNFRADRARELTQAIAEQNINQMCLASLHDVHFVCFTQYNKDFNNVHIAFEPNVVSDNLSAILSQNGLKQLHISETTKYAHVTFFFNGGIEAPYDGEERVLLESENVSDFSQTPQMRAIDIAQRVVEELSKNKYDFVVVNLSNADMVGHTGNYKATEDAVKIVDKCAYLMTLATIAVGGDTIITADHGNADLMLDADGNVITSHSLAPVPFYLVSEKYKNAKLKTDGRLANVAPTILQLLSIPIPQNMSQSLIKD